jgi:hypothetical protein
MEYTTKKIEAGRAIIKEQEARVVHQRRKATNAVNRHPAEEAHARLIVMEQSLLSMKRFLRFLERDLEAELSLHERQSQKRIKAKNKGGRTPAGGIDQLADEFPSRATASILTEDGDPELLDKVAKAMRPAHR